MKEILPGSTGPVARNVVCTSASPSNYPRTRDKLLILVSSANGIQPCDFLSGSADPYVVVNQKEGKKVVKSKRTKTIKNHLTPKWTDPPFDFWLNPDGNQIFEFKVMDEDVGLDEALGIFEVNANELVKEMKAKQTTTLQRRERVSKDESKQNTIVVEVVYTLEQSTTAPMQGLENRLQFIDMDLCWDPCHLQVDVEYSLMGQLGVKFEVTAKVAKLILPARVVLEWKSCPSDEVPTLENIRKFEDKFPKESGGRVLKDISEILLEAGKYYAAFPNMDRVWVCMTSKAIVSVDLTCTVGDIEKLLRYLGIMDLEAFIADLVPTFFPMCVYDATKTFAAQAYKGSAQGDLAALLDPVKAGALQRRAEIVILVRRAELSKSKVCACYCVIRINTETKVKAESDAQEGNKLIFPVRDCMITHASWDTGGPVFMNRRKWRLKDLSRQKISIELWEKVSEYESDQLIGSVEMPMMDFVSNHTIRHDQPDKNISLDLRHGNRLLLDVKINTWMPPSDKSKFAKSARNFKKSASDLDDSASANVGLIQLQKWLSDNKQKFGQVSACSGTLVVRGEFSELAGADFISRSQSSGDIIVKLSRNNTQVPGNFASIGKSSARPTDQKAITMNFLRNKDR